jgi:hypothetical protein
MIYPFLIFIITFPVQISIARDIDLEAFLKSIPGAKFERIRTPAEWESAFKVYLPQPIDHSDFSKGYFYQKIFVTDKNAGNPTVMITEGYDQGFNYIFELTSLLNANQILVEHRFFGESTPDSVDYKYLKAYQTAADLHHILLIFNKYFRGKWISTGVSKGGQNAIFYRYFFPDDVTATVTYVAPVNLSREDRRIYSFLEHAGQPECRRKIRNFQICLLENRGMILPFLEWYCLGANLKFTYLTLEEAFEYTVLEYSFSFWQWGHRCEEIPADSEPVEKLIRHLLSVSKIDIFSDAGMKSYRSHYFQAASELGYYSYNTSGFEKYLKALPASPNPSAIFTPDKMRIEYDSTLALNVYKWTQTKGNGMIYVYGGNDTWTATGVPESKKVDSIWFILEGKDHATARFSSMQVNDKIRFSTFLGRWIETDIQIALPGREKQGDPKVSN